MTGISTIDRFAVLDHLADGSFGPIHLGKDSTSDQQVVIKLCAVEDQGLRQRFFTEAEMATKLNHTHVADVLAAGFHGETPYLVQEYLDGYDLEEIITQRRTWRGTDKLAVLMHVAQGMAYAHSQGVSHHDLKPANVRISGGVAKVMDFGTSRLASTETHTTQRGVTLATASYLPPEQVRSGELDHRVDVFAFGSLAYELFTYQRPFRGQTLSALVYQILYKEPVPMTAVWPECPAPLDKLLTTCLAKDRELRYAGFPQVLAVLQSLHDDAAAGKHPALTVAVAAQPAPEPVDDVMSQSMVTRTAASVAEAPMTSAAATQRIRQDGGPAGASSTETPAGETPTAIPAAGAPQGSSAETVRLAALPDDDDDDEASEDATVIMTKAEPGDPPPRPKVGATTRTEQPPEIPQRPKVGATTRTEQPPETPDDAPERPRVGATTRTEQPASAPDAEPPSPPLPKSTATRHVDPDSGPPAATQRAAAQPSAGPPPVPVASSPPPSSPPPSSPPPSSPPPATTDAVTPSESPSESSPDKGPKPDVADDVEKKGVASPESGEDGRPESKPFNTGKLALSAQEISALVAQGKIEEAQKHLQAMQEDSADAAELPTMAMQRADVDGPASPPSAEPKSAGGMPPLPPASKPSPTPSSTASAASSKTSPPSAPPPSGVQSKGPSPKTPPKTSPKPPSTPVETPPAPGQKTLDRSSAPPSPAPKAKGRGGPPVVLLAGLGIAVVLLAVAGWWFFGRTQPEAPPPVAEVPRPQPPPPSPVGEVAPTGQVLVDASPWGALTEITDGSGYLLELPIDNVTPMVLDLPEGTYNLVLSRGTEAAEAVDGEAPEGLDGQALGELQSCEVEVTLDQPATCRVRFAPPSVTDYFKDAGWWQ